MKEFLTVFLTIIAFIVFATVIKDKITDYFYSKRVYKLLNKLDKSTYDELKAIASNSELFFVNEGRIRFTKNIDIFKINLEYLNDEDFLSRIGADISKINNILNKINTGTCERCKGYVMPYRTENGVHYRSLCGACLMKDFKATSA